MTDFNAIDRHVEERLPAWIEELAALCAIRSEETDGAVLRAAADWTRDRLARLGGSVAVFELPEVAPLVVRTIADENFRLDHAASAARITARFLDQFAALDG